MCISFLHPSPLSFPSSFPLPSSLFLPSSFFLYSFFPPFLRTLASPPFYFPHIATNPNVPTSLLPYSPLAVNHSSLQKFCLWWRCYTTSTLSSSAPTSSLVRLLLCLAPRVSLFSTVMIPPGLVLSLHSLTHSFTHSLTHTHIHSLTHTHITSSPVPDRECITISTPIYYVNGSPHIGHVYSSLIADVLRRWFVIRGARVFVMTGTGA